MAVEVRPGGRLATGQAVSVIELSNTFLQARLLNLGATLWQLNPLRCRASACVTLFHADPVDYAHNPANLGCTVGPLANRVANSAFTLDGRVHTLVANEGPHHLHGGPDGFGHTVWDFETDPGVDAVTFVLSRPDGSGGYPGNLELRVTWALERNSLRMNWTARTDRATPVSITNHTYWNLAGSGTIDDHRLVVDAKEMVDVDDHLIPTGVMVPTAGTPFDLSTNPRVGDVIERAEGSGIDCCYAIEPGSRARLSDPVSGLRLDVETWLPGLQVYTGDKLDGSAAHGRYGPRAGLCLETQFFPDAVNNPQFASPVVPARSITQHWTRYTLSESDAADRQ